MGGCEGVGVVCTLEMKIPVVDSNCINSNKSLGWGWSGVGSEPNEDSDQWWGAGGGGLKIVILIIIHFETVNKCITGSKITAIKHVMYCKFPKYSDTQTIV